MHIHSHRPTDPDRFLSQPQLQPHAHAGRAATSPVGSLETSSDFTGTVNIVTAEGDKVSFSLGVETDFRYQSASPKAQPGSENPAGNGASVEASISQSVALTVEGDLSDQEVADLAKLLKGVTNIFRKFLQGQDEQAVAKTAKLTERFGSLSTLAGFDLNVDVSRSMKVSAAPNSEDPTTLPSNPPAAAPTPVDVSTPPSVGIEPPTQPTVPAAPAESEIPATAADPTAVATATTGSAPTTASEDARPVSSPVNLVLKAMKDLGVDSSRLKQFVPDLIKQALAELREKPELRNRHSLIDQLHADLLRALQERKADPAAAAVTDTYTPKPPAAPALSLVA